MFCNRCGAKIDDGAKFCNICGAPVGQSQQEFNQSVNNQPSPSVLNQQKSILSDKPKKNRKIQIIIAVVAALIIVVVIIAKIGSSGSGNSDVEAVNGNSSNSPVSTTSSDNGGSSNSSVQKIELYSVETFNEGETTDENGTIIGQYDNPKVYNDTSIVINDKKITLPLTLQEFSDQTGFTYELPDNQLSGSTFIIADLEKGDESLSVTLLNNGSSPKAYKDCMVYKVSANVDYLSKTTVSLPCGATLGQRANLGGVINALGNPEYYQNYLSSDPKFTIVNYKLCDDDNFTIEITEEKISTVEIDLSFYR